MQMTRRPVGAVFQIILLASAITMDSLTPTLAAGQENNPPDWIPIRDEDKAAVLEFLCLQVKGNYERIHRWSGKYNFLQAEFFNSPNPALEVNGRPSGPYSTASLPEHFKAIKDDSELERDGHYWLTGGTADFALDNDHDKYFVLLTYDKSSFYLDGATGSVTEKRVQEPAKEFLFTPEKAMELENRINTISLNGFPSRDDVPPSRTAIINPLREGKHSTSVIDIRDCFAQSTTRLVGKKVFYWFLPEKFAEFLRKDEADESRVNAERIVKIYTDTGAANASKYAILLGEAGKNSTRYEIDSQAGFNVTRCTINQNGHLVSRRTTAYREVDGVFIPETFESCALSNGGGKNGVSSVRSISMVESTVNKDLPVNSFELDRMGMQYADRVIDKINGTLSFYDPSTKSLVPESDFTLDESRLPKLPLKTTQPSTPNNINPPYKKTGNKPLLVVNAIFGLVVIGYLALRNSRRMKQRP